MKTIRVCCGPGCLANGSAAVAEEFERLGAGQVQVECQVKRTGCIGLCGNGPLVTVMPDDITYYQVKAADVPEIQEKTVSRGEPVERLLYKDGQGRPARTRSTPSTRPRSRSPCGTSERSTPTTRTTTWRPAATRR